VGQQPAPLIQWLVDLKPFIGRMIHLISQLSKRRRRRSSLDIFRSASNLSVWRMS